MISEEQQAADYSAMPSVVFSVPALATVGLTEAQADASSRKVRVAENDMTSWRSSRTQAERVAYAKVLIDEHSDEIVGAHLVGHGAAETIHALAFAMQHGVTATQLKSTVYAYPTFHSDLKYLV